MSIILYYKPPLLRVKFMIESFKEAFNSSKYFEKGHEQFQLENNIEKCLISLGEEFKRNQMCIQFNITY